jgi:hypothetical protein
MLNILSDGPFRYVHCGATGHLILTLVKTPGGFVEFEGESEPQARTLRYWKVVARKRISGRLITDNPSYVA